MSDNWQIVCFFERDLVYILGGTVSPIAMCDKTTWEFKGAFSCYIIRRTPKLCKQKNQNPRYSSLLTAPQEDWSPSVCNENPLYFFGFPQEKEVHSSPLLVALLSPTFQEDLTGISLKPTLLILLHGREKTDRQDCEVHSLPKRKENLQLWTEGDFLLFILQFCQEN